MPRVDLIQLRAGTAAAWTTANPTLAAGEPGLETDTRKLKFGDGATAWAGLAYATSAGTEHYIGNWATNNAFPATGGTGTAGAVARGDRWRLTVDLTVSGNIIPAGTIIEANTDTPGQTWANWNKYAMQL